MTRDTLVTEGAAKDSTSDSRVREEAQELGMHPKKLGKIANHEQEPWKAPLPVFMEALYFKRFGRELPEQVLSARERAQQQASKKVARKQRYEANRRARAAQAELFPKAEGHAWEPPAEAMVVLPEDDEPPF